jgi:hypothetical protein
MWRPLWLPIAKAAAAAWNGAPGPQFYSFTARSNDTWIYLNYAATGQHGLTSGLDGLTWNCIGTYCSDANVSMRVDYTDVYINHDLMDGDTNAHIQNVFAHESGHGMGLFHNFTDPAALMYPVKSNVGGPTTHDLGAFPGCNGSAQGINCVYGWGD